MITSLCHRSLRIGEFLLCSFVSAAIAAEHPLRNESMAQTEEGRQLLKYMVSCALPAGESVAITMSGTKYAFQGALGLVPGWVDRPMAEEEQRKLSACLAAHTNFFGKPVQISLRSDDPAAPDGLQTTAQEREEFPFFEGGFFGNYFITHPVGYVCLGDAPAERDKHLASLLRVCSLEKESDAQYSRCDLKIVGRCKDKPFIQDGVDYTKEVLWVYLPGPERKSVEQTW